MTDGFVPGVVVPAEVAGHRFLHVVDGSVFIDEDVDVDVDVDVEVEVGQAHFLGMIGDVAQWAVDVPDGEDPSDGAALDLRSFFGRVGEEERLVAGRAVQIVEWARTHRFCGRCGEPTEPIGDERAMRCPRCGLAVFPRVAPAMITLVTRGAPGPDQEILLARGVQFTVPMYSCLAGFVEPGETLESDVVREVREEVGVRVANVTYRASQPWPFPHSLMVGFRAEWVDGDIVCEPSEILDAGWYRRGALPQIPGPISIAHRLITDWVGEVD